MFGVGVAAMKFDSIRTAPYNPQIHNFGNVGPSGMVHALTATMATRIIDKFAYGGRNMRNELAMEIARTNPNAAVLEVGCGVGTLTRELIQNNISVIAAVDTSHEMIQQAKREVPEQTFEIMNGVDVGTKYSEVDLTIACMLVHELPKNAHIELIQALMNVTKEEGEVWIVDIDPSYQPSEIMLSGEPYVLRYLDEFESTLEEVSNAHQLTFDVWSIIPEHVKAYMIRRAPAANKK